MFTILSTGRKRIFSKLGQSLNPARFLLIAWALLILGDIGWANGPGPGQIDPKGKNLSAIFRNLPAGTGVYSFYPSRDSHEGAVEAKNLNHNLSLNYRDGGLNITSTEALWSLRFQLLSMAQGSERLDLSKTASRLTTIENRLENRRRNVTEWYVNNSRGLEQGFILDSPLSSTKDTNRSTGGNEFLRVEMALLTDLLPIINDEQTAISFRDQNNKTIYRYDHLYVFDAQGKELPSRLELNSGHQLTADASPISLSILVDDSEAVYPITIDPLLTNQAAKVIASDGAANDQFGFTVAIDGDTAVVGIEVLAGAVGAAYVFLRDQGGTDNWGQVAKLTPSDGIDGDNFGTSVAIDGNTIVVGAPWKNSFSGAAYVYERDFGDSENWGEVEILVGSEVTDNHQFGFSVSISGDNIAINAPSGDGDSDQSGAAYIFERDTLDANNWNEVQKIFAVGEFFPGWLNSSLTINGDLVIVGASFGQAIGQENDNGVAYIFSRDKGGTDNWGQLTAVMAGDADSQPTNGFGFSVDVDGDMLVVGARGNDVSGAVYIYNRHQGGTDNWGQLSKLNPAEPAPSALFGTSVSISGNTVAVGATEDSGLDGGSIYVYQRDEGGVGLWGQSAKLKADDEEAGDRLGFSVALDGSTLITGADGDDLASSSLTYNVTSGPANGQLELSDNPNVAILTFTQENIDDLLLRYVHDDSATTSGDFEFVVTDGVNTSDTHTFTILVTEGGNTSPVETPVNETPKVDLNTGVAVVQGGTVNITSNELSSSGTEAGSAYIYDFPLTTGVVGNIMVLEDAPDSVLNLDTAFDALVGDPSDLTYSVHRDSQPGIVSAVADNVANTLTLDFLDNQFGFTNITVRAEDAFNVITEATFLVSVESVNDPPVASDDSITLTEGGTVSALANGDLTLLENDTDVDFGPDEFFPLDSLLVNTILVSGPSFGMLTLSFDGSFTYSHGGAEVFADSFVYEISDQAGATAHATVSIVITPVNDNVPIANDDATSVMEGGIVSTLNGGITSLIANDTDADLPGDMLFISATPVTPVDHGVLTLAANGAFTYQHNDGEVFADSFIYALGDGSFTSTATVNIMIFPVNDNFPVANNDFATLSEGASEVNVAVNNGATSVLANDSDVDLPGDNLTVNLIPVIPAINGTLILRANGSFDYNHDGSETLTDSFTYEMGDGAASATATVHITIIPQNDPPVAVDDFAILSEGASVLDVAVNNGATSVLANDSDVDLPGDNLTVNLMPVIPVINGTLILRANGSFDYNHDGSETLTDSFTYEMGDGAASATATVHITIIPQNDPPVAVDDFATLSEGASVLNVAVNNGATSVLANDSDVDLPGDNLTVNLIPVIPAINGTLILRANGSFDYNHDGSETLTDSFTYEMGDGAASATATVHISITPVNDQPTTIVLPDVLVDENAADTVIDLEIFFDDIEDGSAGLSYTVEDNTAPGLFTSFLISGSTLTLKYADDSPGTAIITIRATDSGPGPLFVESTFTVTINELANTIDNWRLDFFGPEVVGNPALEDTDWGDLANPDGDNLSNLVEYFMGLDPTTNDEAGLITLTISGNTILYTYQRALDAPDAVGNVEWSEDLATWSTTGITEEILSAGADTETVQATITLTGSETAVFVRIQVDRIDF